MLIRHKTDKEIFNNFLTFIGKYKADIQSLISFKIICNIMTNNCISYKNVIIISETKSCIVLSTAYCENITLLKQDIYKITVVLKGVIT